MHAPPPQTRDIPLSRITAALSDAQLLVEVRGNLPDTITSIEDDSRRVAKGSAFIAIRGSERDGHDFLERAKDAGASVAILENATRTTLPALIIREGRRAAAVAAAAAFDFPARDLRLVGITGTNGKTTTAHIVRHLLDSPRAVAASIGTVGVLVGSEGRPHGEDTGLTTPGPVELQRLLRSLVDAGVRQIAMEVSSHALHQQRVGGVDFEAVVFTNLSRDHLDYHKTMDAYREAKARLLEHLAPHGAVIVNQDEPAWRSIITERRKVSFSVRVPTAEVNAQHIRFTSHG